MIQQAYDSHREAYLQKNIAGLTADPPVKPQADQALLNHLSTSPGDTSRDAQDVNCMVIWARPPPAVIAKIKDIQSKIRNHPRLGEDAVWLVPEDDLHLSVLELSHRHPTSHLRNVLNELGTDRMHSMLSVPSSLDEKPVLVRPRLGFDKLGFALSMVPSADTRFTYHHLRADLQRRALESGIAIDTCYTALSAHVTIARFTRSGFLDGDYADDDLEWVKALNAELEGDPVEWVVDELELQLGFLKFGRARCEAEYVSVRANGS